MLSDFWWHCLENQQRADDLSNNLCFSPKEMTPDPFVSVYFFVLPILSSWYPNLYHEISTHSSWYGCIMDHNIPSLNHVPMISGYIRMNLPVRSPFQQPGVPRAGERDLWWLRRDQWAQLTAPGWEGNRRLDLDEEWMPWMVAVDVDANDSISIIMYHLFSSIFCLSIFIYLLFIYFYLFF